MGIFDNKQTLLSSLDRKGLIIIGVIFSVLAVLLSILATVFTSTVIENSMDLWRCNNTEKFDSKQCMGYNAFNKEKDAIQYDKVKVHFGYFSRFNYEARISLSAEIKSEELKTQKTFIVPIHYFLGGYSDEEAMKNVDPELTETMNINFECSQKSCKSDFLLKFKADYHFYYFIFQTDNSYKDEIIMKPTLTLMTSNSFFTVTELFWRIAFVCVGSIQLMTFMYCMRTIPIKEWIFEQILTFTLMYILLLFNNPLALIEYQAHHWFFSLISSVVESFAISFFLFYILIIFDSLRKPINKMSTTTLWFKFIGVRVIFVGIIFITLCCFIFTQKVFDIKYLIAGTSNVVLIILGVIVLLIILTYAFWLIFSLIRTFTERHKLGEKSRRVIGFSVFNIVIVFIFIIVLSILLFDGYDASSIYLASIVYFNLYCFAMALLMVKNDKQELSRRSKKFEISHPTEVSMEVNEYNDDDEIIIKEQPEEGILVDEQISL
ncbi:Hypothetical protein EHI5A_263210 [Entamoeba histolytica KU27]|uniref:Wntless-like transmembrane domain-containing protein n=1 Tax=Entamoeba histolytica KU27 TaxID=885311 RepID=M2RUE1_ENTHI|nr:Hypothetical protein EHI5A_263210 [Entamoeba histolytica KU27]